jgi:SAM-dependent methyltransferase
MSHRLHLLPLLVTMVLGIVPMQLHCMPAEFNNVSAWHYLLLALGVELVVVLYFYGVGKKKFPAGASWLKKTTNRQDMQQYFEAVAPHSNYWSGLNRLYHSEIARLCRFLIPPSASVIECGCATAELLGKIPAAEKTGIDFCSEMINVGSRKWPAIKFVKADIEQGFLESACDGKKYDYVIMSDLLGTLYHVQQSLENVAPLMHADSRLVITSHNYVWEPLLRLLEIMRLKRPQPRLNWLSTQDICGLLHLAGFELIKKGTHCLLPLSIPLLGWVANRFLVHLPLLRHFGVIQSFVARKIPTEMCTYSVSVVIPARNESGNIREALLRTPQMGNWTELIFVEGHSTDDTWETIQKVKDEFSTTHRIKILRQKGKGKGDAVRAGFDVAEGDIVTILDADLTMPPEALPRYYRAIASGRADFVNGSRLVYPLENQAMRFFNIFGNKFFSLTFSWLLGQPIKDTLCGTKMLSRKHYEQIKANRSYFGDFDPFGDFDLIFGAAKLNLKICDMPIHYKARIYGDTNIQRWSHGVILLRMVVFALFKIKFI